MVSGVHDEPFQVSATTPVLAAPTAAQSLEAEHETENRMFAVLDGSEVVSTDHFEPFHSSASVELPELSWVKPTAAQLLEGEEVHETLFKMTDAKPSRSGVVWTDHDVPFHTSASAAPEPVSVSYDPTAVQASDDVHETPTI
jgi:hypothetical protein